ncbi:MAG: 16S rRNA processing protein RimM [Butyrivibrio sp.]|nr:16S rRNA processing protein RimM [Butyrivibrio sp.]
MATERTERFQIGIITKPHGLQGEVSVFPTTEDPGRFRRLKSVFLDDGHGGVRQLEVERGRMNGKLALVKFRGMDRVEDVERLRGKELSVAREDAIPLREGEYYAADLIGLTVVDEADGRTLGTITQVIETGANDVYEMACTDTDAHVMLPAIRECIRGIDLENRTMTVHVMPGLID